uniref:Uncharacterized protein n=1 Tax=Parascaris univalens TaxID=6257 RepID=A0A915BY70_PARUN
KRGGGRCVAAEVASSPRIHYLIQHNDEEMSTSKSVNFRACLLRLNSRHILSIEKERRTDRILCDIITFLKNESMKFKTN